MISKNIVLIVAILMAVVESRRGHNRYRGSWGSYNQPRNNYQNSEYRVGSRVTLDSNNIRVVDGDSINHGNIRFRLHGIDAPELRQNCGNGSGSWPCGQASKAFLQKQVQGKTLQATIRDIDRYGRYVAEFKLDDGTNVNAELVKEGLATAYTRYSKDYKHYEDQARSEGKNIWSGEFVNPEQYRHDDSL